MFIHKKRHIKSKTLRSVLITDGFFKLRVKCTFLSIVLWQLHIKSSCHTTTIKIHGSFITPKLIPVGLLCSKVLSLPRSWQSIVHLINFPFTKCHVNGVTGTQFVSLSIMPLKVTLAELFDGSFLFAAELYFTVWMCDSLHNSWRRSWFLQITTPLSRF